MVVVLPSFLCSHVGDLGNLYSDEDGRINDEIEDTLVSLFGPYSVIGRAFVVIQNKFIIICHHCVIVRTPSVIASSTEIKSRKTCCSILTVWLLYMVCLIWRKSKERQTHLDLDLPRSVA